MAATRKKKEPPYGFVDDTGELVIPARFDQARSFHEGLCAVRVGAKWGYIDPSGAMVLEPQWKEALDFEHGFAFVKGKDHVAIDKRGEPQAYWRRPGTPLACEHPYVDTYGSTCGRRWHLLDGKDRILLSFDQAPYEVDAGLYCGYAASFGHVLFDARGKRTPLPDGITSVGRFVDRSFLRRDGTQLEGPWEGVKSFSGGLAPVKIKDKWGYIAATGALAIEPQFFDAQSFHEGVAVVEEGYWVTTMIDRTGRSLLDRRYAHVSPPDADGLVFVQNNFHDQRGVHVLQAGLVDATGETVLPMAYARLERATKGLYRACKDGKWGYIRLDGTEVIPHAWDAIGKWSRLIPVKRGDLWGYLDRKGHVVVEPQHLACANMFEGLARIRPTDAKDAKRYPFLFFGVHPADWIAEYDEAHLYRLKFRTTPSKALQKKIDGVLPKDLRGLSWDGAYALMTASQTPEIRDMFATVRTGVEAAHRIAPLEEVVAMCARGGWGNTDPWDRWTQRQAKAPSDGPLWGRCLLI
jgi:hypothetical protein